MSTSDNPRIFNPAQQIRANPSKTITQPSDILYHDLEAGVRRLIMYALFAPEIPRVVRNSLVISISGRSTGGTKPAYAVYFAPDSPFNSSGLLPDPDPGSASDSTAGAACRRAEFYALSKALGVVEERAGETSRVVFITEARAMVEGLAEQVWEWEFNGYEDAEGKAVVNGEAFRELHARIGRLEGAGMDVSFWAVRRDENVEADGLANATFGSAAE